MDKPEKNPKQKRLRWWNLPRILSGMEKTLRVKFLSTWSLLAAVLGLFTAALSTLLMRNSERPPFQIIANVTDTLWSRRCRGLGGVEASREGGCCCIIDVGSCLKWAYWTEFPTTLVGSGSITIFVLATMEKKKSGLFCWCRSSVESLSCRQANHSVYIDCSHFHSHIQMCGGNQPFNKTNGCLWKNSALLPK